MAEAARKKVVTYDYTHVPTIRRFAHCKARHRVLIGPFGSGKSVGCLMEIIRLAHEQAPSPSDGIRRTRWAIIRNTYRQLEDTTMKTVFDWFPPEQYGVHRVADHDYIVTEFPGVRIELCFRALDRPDHVKNLLSLEITGAWINEAREVPRAIWEGVDGRIGRYPSRRNGGCTRLCIIMDTNPPDEDNWLYKLVEKEKPHNLERFRQPGGRSPQAENIPNLPERYYEDLAIGKTPEYIRVYIDGEYGFTLEGTPVYQSSFSDDFHVAKRIIEPIRTLNVIAGFDFYRHPACILSQLTYRGQWRVLDEFYEANMGVERFMKQRVEPVLIQKYRGMGVFGFGDPTGRVKDSTDERNAYDVLKKFGLRAIKPAWTNAVMTRIGAVESFLLRMVGPGEPAFLLSPNCIMLRKGFNGGYQYKDGVPRKNDYSNPHDGLQYAALFIQRRQGQKEQAGQRRPRTQHQPASRAGY
ncbi:MAG: Terminase-like family protein [Syntrophorhabdus sp. PtaU1.Bin153]|nr:MAG: Terminase-like family protein [Syntrophorhabdus sp. PtaU1.Bin153]